MEDNKHAIWFALLVVISLASYGLYSETQSELQEAQEQIARLVSENEETISSQQEIIEEQEVELQEAKENEELLQNAVDELQSSGGGASLSVSGTINELAPSVVRLVCLADESGALQQGSGVLFEGGNGVLGPYYVQTNLHVVDPNDGSSSQCVIVVYPNPSNSEEYVIYKSNGYSLYQSGVDLAYIEPVEVENNSRAGRIQDLSSYAVDDSTTRICESVSIGDHVSVLGYPSIGGESLTVTDGIVSGFEFRSGERYIKTSAKIDRGNSGGIAIGDSGCVVGIPTFVQAQIESLGRILDLDRLLD